MWLPAFKYVKGLLAQRGQFTLPNGKPYEGPYHKLYTGETFTGDVPSVDSKRIFEDDSEPHLSEPTYEEMLVSEPVFPNVEDYDKGFFLRYFIKDNRNGKIIEVKKDTWSKKLVEKYLSGVTVKWILDKPVKDIFSQGYLYKGAESRNKENTLKASLEMKGLAEYITEYDKFANIQSDVEGYKFEELPKPEKIRIIRQISNIQKSPPPPKPRFEERPKKQLPRKKVVQASALSNPRRSGGGSRGRLSSYETGIFSEDGQNNGFDVNDNLMQY